MLRKKPTQDFQTSLNRFTELGRDPVSRAKHFRNVFDALNSQERKQLFQGFGFELFHLIDALFLSHYDTAAVHPQTVTDIDSALWMLEQVLCWAPELVGRGWQKCGIEFVLKMALHPNNVSKVRRLAIRLFLIWFQELAAFGQTNRSLDIVFQCCMPYFPLRSQRQTEDILIDYCEGAESSNGQPSNGCQSVSDLDPCAVRALPIVQTEAVESNQPPSSMVHQPQPPTKLSYRERAEELQEYLDKFLEYTTRETKVEWADPAHRLDCAKFVLDRVIVLYIYEVFPDAENNGVDVFGGWEGTCEGDDGEAMVTMLDTIDPIVIARYWLIRWIVNIASDNESKFIANSGTRKQPSPGLPLYKQVLFGSQKAVNVLLTLMREAFRLPLACVNVVQKVLDLLRHWLLQREFPPFVDSGLVSAESWTILLLHSLFSFFRSPYLLCPGDRLPHAITITHSILQIVRDLTNPSATLLARPLSKGVWKELIKELSTTVELVTAKSDAFGQSTASSFTRTLLSVFIFVRVIREVELDDERMWDDAWAVFRYGKWTQQMVEQWARVVDSMTRALVLNLFAIDVGLQRTTDGAIEDGIVIVQPHQLLASETTSSNGSYRHQPLSRTVADHVSSESGSAVSGPIHQTVLGTEIGEEDEQHSVGTSGGELVQGVVQSTGNAPVWLRAWMRVVCLVDPAAHPLAVQTLGRAVDILLRIGCANQLVHWLCANLLVRLRSPADQPHAIGILAAALRSSDPPPLERAYILHHLLCCLRQEEMTPMVLDHVPSFSSLEDMAVISQDTIVTLQKLVRNQEFSSRAIRVATLLSLNHPEAEKILLSLLEQPQLHRVDPDSLVHCLNALCLLVLERADAPLFDALFRLIISQQYNHSVLPVFCANLNSVSRLGFHQQLVQALLQSLPLVRNGRVLNDLKWQLCALFSRDSVSLHWSSLADRFLSASDDFFEGFVLRLSGQYPLPGFPCHQWNSLPAFDRQRQNSDGETFMETEGAILSLDANSNLWSRTFLGRHCYSTQPIRVDAPSANPVDQWLSSLASAPDSEFQSPASSVRQKSQSFGAAIDPFQDFPRPSVRSTSFTTSCSSLSQRTDLPLFDISGPEMLQFVQSSTRNPEEFGGDREDVLLEHDGMQCFNSNDDDDDNERHQWCQFVSSFGLVANTRVTPQNFHREVRHLDTALCREVHKVALIYVAKDQQDKQSILSNTAGSETFNRFVEGLGWLVQTGSPQFHGYSGGLPSGQLIPYYCSANTELIFHVSTMLNGDNTQRLKHLGNDEVHVVWSENTKPYRRDLIATRFCDVLIVMYLVSPVLLRVHIEVQDQRLQFGPLFDGACIHVLQAASLVRETVLNASRAYRCLRVECERPNKHREQVFREKKNMLDHLPLAPSIIKLYTAK